LEHFKLETIEVSKIDLGRKRPRGLKLLGIFTTKLLLMIRLWTASRRHFF
jgi:hypothetical protein